MIRYLANVVSERQQLYVSVQGLIMFHHRIGVGFRVESLSHSEM